MEECVANEINISGRRPASLQRDSKVSVLWHSARVPQKNVSPDLLVAADKYGLDDLKNMCESSLASHLDAENVIEFLFLAEDTHCPSLLEKASVVFRSHFESFAQTDRLDELERHPSLLKKLLKLGQAGFDSF